MPGTGFTMSSRALRNGAPPLAASSVASVPPALSAPCVLASGAAPARRATDRTVKPVLTRCCLYVVLALVALAAAPLLPGVGANPWTHQPTSVVPQQSPQPAAAAPLPFHHA